MALSLLNLGDFYLMTLKDTPSARQSYQEAVNIREELVRSAPQDKGLGCPPESGPADMIVRGNQIQGGSDGKAEEPRGDQAAVGGGGARPGQGALGGGHLPQAG